MGIPILDTENIIPKCYASSEKSEAEQKQEENIPTQSMASKDLVGNCKEVRIDCNKINLRIIGNGNKIRINRNLGHLCIVGNGTRVKITHNSGSIKFTGNNGRIYLGIESTEQGVDYIGNNGILKVVKATELRTDRSTDRVEKCKSSTFDSSSSSDSESSRKHKCSSSKRSSSSDFCGFNIQNNISLPNLNQTGYRKSANITNCINLSNSTGNITIKNAINVTI